MKTSINSKLFFVFVFFIAVAFRVYGINWDSGFHLHPDERAIIMAALTLHLPTSLGELLSPASSLNPHFFAYGNFPLYLLAFFGWLGGIFNPFLGSYDGILFIGRTLSVFFDLGTVCLLYLLGRRLRSPLIGLLAAFFYAVSLLPIQLSHFFAVDTPLTFFSTLFLYLLIRYYEKPAIKKAVLLGITFGLSLTTKASAVVLAVPLGVTLLVDDTLLACRRVRHLPRLKPFLRHISPLLLSLLVTGVALGITAFLTEPYGFIDRQEFLNQLGQQSAMTKDPFLFPYTLQYVGITHYIYEIRNLVFFGQGILLSLLSYLGIFYTVWQIIVKKKDRKWAQELILLVFAASYFGIVGNFAVGYMRYLLPLYPLLAIFAALLAEDILRRLAYLSRFLAYFIPILFGASLLLYPLTFLHIYAVPNTRVQATAWILQHIPAGSRLAVEHWDDALPLTGQGSYRIATLPLYDPDTAAKWQQINRTLEATDYIIIASMRLAAPLQRLTNCRVLPPDRCYPITAAYYKSLFSGSLGFTKVADFTVYPTVPFLHIPIPDDSADESFTVYDHPHVMLFKKIDRTK